MSFAKRQLEKYGWKHGDGLGKDGQGTTEYIKVERRQPTCTSGIGHDASQPTDDGSYGATLRILRGCDKTRKCTTKSECSASNKDSPGTLLPKQSVIGEKRVDVSRSSSSSTSSSKDDDGPADVTSWTDAQLFRRCRGVRLGRAGRHRLFSGKLARIESSNIKSPLYPPKEK